MGRLDGWLDLVGWMSGSIVCPTAGDGVVLATVCYNSRAPISVIILALWVPITFYSLSGLVLVSAARGLFKAVIPGMHGIHQPDQSSSILKSHGTHLYTHGQYSEELLHIYFDYRHLIACPVSVMCIYIFHGSLYSPYLFFVHLLGRIWALGLPAQI